MECVHGVFSAFGGARLFFFFFDQNTVLRCSDDVGEPLLTCRRNRPCPRQELGDSCPAEAERGSGASRPGPWSESESQPAPSGRGPRVWAVSTRPPGLGDLLPAEGLRDIPQSHGTATCTARLLQWDLEEDFPASCGRGVGEEVPYDNAGLYDNLPSPRIFARCSADRKASRPASNHGRPPASRSPPPAPSLTNTSSVGRASLGPPSQFKGKKPPAASTGVPGKGKAGSGQQKRAESAAGVRRTASNADQYKYGKNRVEADAKRLQSKEEELVRRKEALRTRLAQLRQERRDLRAAIEANAGRQTQVLLEDKLKKLEEECKQKEAERVNLELELTEVKESLRTALAGGLTLGLAIEPKSGTSSPQVSAPAPCSGLPRLAQAPAPREGGRHSSSLWHPDAGGRRIPVPVLPGLTVRGPVRPPLQGGGLICCSGRMESCIQSSECVQSLPGLRNPSAGSAAAVPQGLAGRDLASHPRRDTSTVRGPP
uniref:Actin filament associated protein 1 n=1 Tax=Oryctolagus cuniculus TaxID=9986 RepID=A0A5F9DD87_RABIT